jgi:capsular exopolysaccharide synthesis family protein
MREALNTRVHTAAEIGERLDLPLLARIPEPPRYYRRKNRLLMLRAPLTPEAESYQVLATNLEFVNLDREVKSILITSARREEGKSTLAANLAIALARGGKRVVLVDLDLRRPSLSDFFDIAPGLGLTQLLIGRAELGEALVSVPLVEANELETGHSGGGSLDVLPTGSIPPNPAELARSHALSGVLDRLEERADVVLIDAPPILGLSDAMTLSAKADALVLVTRLPDLKRPLLDELRRVLDSAPIVKLGYVVTGAPVEGHYGYGYGYAAREGARKTRGGVQSGENA